MATARVHHPPGGRSDSDLLHWVQRPATEAELLRTLPTPSDARQKFLGSSQVFDMLHGVPLEARESPRPSIRIMQRPMTGSQVPLCDLVAHAVPDGDSGRRVPGGDQLAKAQELSGTWLSSGDAQPRTLTAAKQLELSGHDIFADVPSHRRHVPCSGAGGSVSQIAFSETGLGGVREMDTPKPARAAKSTELYGSGIFVPERDSGARPNYERTTSSAKMREMSGSNIFASAPAAGRPTRRPQVSGTSRRQPPGGPSTFILG